MALLEAELINMMKQSSHEQPEKDMCEGCPYQESELASCAARRKNGVCQFKPEIMAGNMEVCDCPEGNHYDACPLWIAEFPKNLNHYEKALLVMKKGVHREGLTVIDLQTANAMKTVYEHISDKNQEKFNSIDLHTLALKTWKIIGSAKAK